MKSTSVLCRLAASLLASTLTPILTPILIPASIPAQSASAPKYAEFPPFAVTPGAVDSDGLPTAGAKLCVSGKQGLCYQMPAETYGGAETTPYEFGLQPQSQRLPLAGGGSWVLFSAMFSGGGSGTLTRLAVLRYTANPGTMTNLLPYVAATNISEWAMWTVPTASAYPILVHADFVWGDGETHFDPHFYTVEAWKFSPGTDQYAKVFQYQTTKKYAGGDPSPVKVLEPERTAILQHLAGK